MTERRGAVPQSRRDPGVGNREAGWDPTSWYGGESVLPEWARQYIGERRGDHEGGYVDEVPNAGHIPTPPEIGLESE